MLNTDKLTKPFNQIKVTEKIFIFCDYCGIEYYQKKVAHLNGHKTIKKDCCSNKNCINKKKKEVFLEKYGVEHQMQLSAVKEKIKETNLEKYGVENTFASKKIQEKIKQTNVERYGVEHPNQCPEILKKTRETNLEKYGVEYQISSPETREKIKQTNVERYGVENPNQCPEILKKTRETNMEKYGVEYIMQSPEIQEKSKITNLEKYGVEFITQLPETIEKTKRTNLERYGVEYATKLPEIKEKVKQTNIERYGVENKSKLPEFQEKIKQANLQKYGCKCCLQAPEIQKKSKQTNLEKYGVEHPTQSLKIQEKIKKTNLQQYGLEYAIGSPEIQEKIRQTNLEKHGYECCLQSPEIQEKIRQTNIQRYGSPYPQHKYGKTQKEIQKWLNSFGFNFQSDYIVLNGKELDLYDENLKFAIEYCGLHWHHENSPQPRDKNYHESKYKKCKDQDIQLITIFEDEWLNNKEIIKSVILSKLGIFNKRIYARKCIVKEISKKEFTDFCNQYHVQGGNSLAKVCLGLFYEDELIGVMDLGNHHRKKTKDEMVLTRLCFKAGYQIIGGASKLFNACINWCKNNGIKKIISWSDNRWSNGSIYKNLNFQLEEELNADYAYVNIDNPKQRISKQSQMKNKTNCPKDKTEKEWALENGLSRIWDCGKIRWNFDIRFFGRFK